MNIVIIGTAYPLRGGIAHYNALLYRELSRSHTVHIITFKRQYPSLLFPGKTQLETGGELLRVPSETLVDSINPFNWFFVAKRVKRLKPDLIIFKFWLPFFGPCFGTITRLVRRGTTTKALFICDNVVPHEKRPGDRLFTRYAFGPVNYFVVQSDAVEHDLKSFWPRARYRKVPHPVYNIFGTPIAKEEARTRLDISATRVILFFGYIRKYKGLHVLLEAMKLLNDTGVHLLAVGECYDDEQAYRNQIAALQIQDRVTLLTDYVPNDQVGVYFSAADVVILPYLSATQSGIAQIAYNFDKPVIATTVGGLAEVVIDGETGYLIPPDDSPALAQSIKKFFEEEKADRFNRNVEREKKRYTWEAMVKAIEELVSQ
jgi:glycosyltransferase involved in cell wall biosynthesis